MGDINRITIEGKGYVLLPEADYEDMVDIIEARAIKARIDAGEETWPDHIVKALLAGENPVRVFRKYRDITSAELAKTTSLSQAYISEIETGKKAGSVDAIKAIANALNVSMDDLT